MKKKIYFENLDGLRFLCFFSVNKYWVPFTSIMLGSLIFRGMYNNAAYHKLHTFSCIGGMTIGVLGAWFVSQKPKALNFIENLGKVTIAMVYFSFFMIFLFRDKLILMSQPVRIVERAIIAIVILFIILEQNYAKYSFFKLSKFTWISKLGVITYGLYCLHKIAILITITLTNELKLNIELWHTMILDPIVALILTVIIAKISFRFYESPFLCLKNKLAYITK